MLHKLEGVVFWVISISMVFAKASGQQVLTAAMRHGQLTVEGNRIVDRHDEPARLRGLSFS